jgi:hypothetical protein
VETAVAATGVEVEVEEVLAPTLEAEEVLVRGVSDNEIVSTAITITTTITETENPDERFGNPKTSRKNGSVGPEGPRGVVFNVVLYKFTPPLVAQIYF